MGNLCNSNSSHHCCLCCFCCLDEGEKVELVLKRFVAVPVSRAEDSTMQKLVGRVVLAGAPFYAPANKKPCVWYHVQVWEERVEHRTHRDSNGNTHTSTHHYWHEIVNREASSDFYLQDGQSKVFIQASNRDLIKVQGTKDQGGENIFSNPPPGIAELIASSMSDFSWAASGYRTGRFKYQQASFDVNELIAALGVVQPATDPYTGQSVKCLLPINGNLLNEKFFAEQKWENWDIESWKDLVEQSPAVLLSDDISFTNNVQVAPIQNLPAFMVYDPNRPFGGGAPMAVVASPHAPMMMPMQPVQPMQPIMQPIMQPMQPVMQPMQPIMQPVQPQQPVVYAQTQPQQPVVYQQQPQPQIQVQPSSALTPSAPHYDEHMPSVIGQQPAASSAPPMYTPAGEAQHPPAY